MMDADAEDIPCTTRAQLSNSISVSVRNAVIPVLKFAPSEQQGERLQVDTRTKRPNNSPMTKPAAKPETVRRIKSYSAATGYVYQYQFQDAHPAPGDTNRGNEYVYYVSADRKTMFPVRILVDRTAIDNWTRQTGRALTGTEEYAIAKMRLFQAFDEIEDFAASQPSLAADESNLAELIERLDL